MRRQLRADGYAVHLGAAADDPEIAGRYWFTWMNPGMPDVEVGPTCETELAAWSSALAHRLDNSEIELELVGVESRDEALSTDPMRPAWRLRETRTIDDRMSAATRATR